MANQCVNLTRDGVEDFRSSRRVNGCRRGQVTRQPFGASMKTEGEGFDSSRNLNYLNPAENAALQE